ncbi:MAG: hypothetical protein COU51_03315 [Parcubacteria group bacterium CG10_big_fil_rev_8_21_14_0_10_36_14]|nr:MAG: hypothetical protein COU51_03315 [Parcubacteria group bacterium CG10_big_fil_rev_8_21_14_0_10_36_14]
MILNILYHGLSCFSIEAKGVNKTTSLVINPFDTKGMGLRLPRTLSAEIVAIIDNKNKLYNNFSAVSGSELVVTEPGEYEKGGIFIYGIPVKSDTDEKTEESMIFRFEFEDMAMAHLGGLKHKLRDESLSELENIDILLLPVGGGDSIDYKKAAEIANQIEPRVIIPMQYKMPGLTINLDDVQKFLKEYGTKEETMNKLKIARKDLPEEETKVIVLEKA